MPIKGLTDRGLSFPEIGQIRKGAKKGDNRPGADLTYFRVEFGDKEQATAENFRKVYGDQPNAIRIILPFNETERMWDAWLEAYTAGRMVARSDGEFIKYQLDDQGEIVVKNGFDLAGNLVPHPADNIAGHDYKGRDVEFKPTGRLKVIIPELSRAAYLTVMTTSVHDIGNISAQLGAFKELNEGQLAGIPFVLRRKPKEISTPSGQNGQRARRVKWLISIEADQEWVKARLGGLKNLAMPNAEELLLPASIPEQIDSSDYEPDEDEIIEGEEWEGGLFDENEPATREPGEPGISAQMLVDEEIVEQVKHAEALLLLLSIPSGAPAGQALKRINLYMQWRKVYAKNTEKDRKLSAEKAIAGEQP